MCLFRVCVLLCLCMKGGHMYLCVPVPVSVPTFLQECGDIFSPISLTTH